VTHQVEFLPIADFVLVMRDRETTQPGPYDSIQLLRKKKIYRKPIDVLEEATTGMADLISVNSSFTASTVANTFQSLYAKGIHPIVLYPAV
jgi:hypothetical protein